MSRIKRDINSIVKDSAAIKKATLDEDAAIKDILELLQEEWREIIVAIQAHEDWFKINPRNASTVLIALIGKINKSARNVLLLKRLNRSEAKNLKRMAALGENLSNELIAYSQELRNGEIKSKVAALEKLKKILLAFDEGLKLVAVKQYRIDDFVRKVA